MQTRVEEYEELLRTIILEIGGPLADRVAKALEVRWYLSIIYY